MENVNWGIPALRVKREDKYTTPVVIMNSLSLKGAGRKFCFNRAAQNIMGMNPDIEQTVLVGFGPEGEIYFKIEDGENENGYKLTKTGTFSNKRVYEYVVKYLKLDTDQDNAFNLFLENENIYRMEKMKELEVLLPNAETPNEESTFDSTEETEGITTITDEIEESDLEVTETESTDSSEDLW